MTPEMLLLLGTARGTLGNSIGRGGKPKYTLSDLGIALAGLHPLDRRHCYAAFAYRGAGADSEWRYLKWALFMAAVDISNREQWCNRIRNEHYLERLVDLAILEERCPRVGQMRLLWKAMELEMGFPEMDEELWDRTMSRKYTAIRNVIETWCATAEYNCEMKLRKDNAA